MQSIGEPNSFFECRLTSRFRREDCITYITHNNEQLNQNKLKTTETELEKTTKEKTDLENKLRILVKEVLVFVQLNFKVKTLRTKNNELEEAYKGISTGYVDLKIAFDNLQIEEDF